METSNIGVGFKELYEVFIKATYPMIVNGKKYEIDETILAFDEIKISYLKEKVSRKSAKGGFDNRGLVFWETSQAIDFSFQEGIFSIDQLALINNANTETDVENILIPKRDKIESDELGQIIFTKEPISSSLRIYDLETGEKLAFEQIDDLTYQISGSFKTILADYYYNYQSTNKVLNIGQRAINGFVKLEAKTRVKDDTNGRTTTGIFIIPKLRLMSDLSITLGQNANPVVATFKATGEPDGGRKNSKVMQLIFLDDDIDSDF